MINPKMIPVEDHPNLFRDPVTNAIINMDTRTARSNRDARQRAKQRDKDIENLKNDMAEIKELLTQLLASKN
jgi:DNA-binding transcriptional regulator GbsR (MarR family)